MSPSGKKKPEVMAGLPTTRPQRRSARRERAGRPDTPGDAVPSGAASPARSDEAQNHEAPRATSARAETRSKKATAPTEAKARPKKATEAKARPRKVAAAEAKTARGTGTAKARAGSEKAATSRPRPARRKQSARADGARARAAPRSATATAPTLLVAADGRERLPQPGQPRSLPPQPPDTAEPPPPARPGGGEIIGTAIQAAGELAEIGLTLGTQALRNAISRLPRP